YCVDKTMRASAAAVYWRTINDINRQRLWMSARLAELHEAQGELSFTQARRLAATELLEREPIVSAHYSLLEGSDRFTRLPQTTTRTFQPLRRDSCDFPSPVRLFTELGVRKWFAPLRTHRDAGATKRYCVEKDALTLPTFALQVIDRRPVGKRHV